MKSLLYAAAVLGSRSDDSANNPNIITSVLGKLHAIDKQLIQYANEEDRSGIDHTDETQALLDKLDTVAEALADVVNVEIYYNDEVPFGEVGRLRMVLPGTAWDIDSPLFLVDKDDLCTELTPLEVSNDQSYGEAEKIAAQKGDWQLLDGNDAKKYAGEVLGVTAHHVVQSLGRSAAIHHKNNLDQIPAKGELVEIAYDGLQNGKVTPAIKGQDKSVSR